MISCENWRQVLPDYFKLLNRKVNTVFATAKSLNISTSTSHEGRITNRSCKLTLNEHAKIVYDILNNKCGQIMKL